MIFVVFNFKYLHPFNQILFSFSPDREDRRIFVGAEREENLIRNDPDKSEFTTFIFSFFFCFPHAPICFSLKLREIAPNHSLYWHSIISENQILQLQQTKWTWK